MGDKLFHGDYNQRQFADFLMAEDADKNSELFNFMPSHIYSMVNIVAQGKSYTKSDKRELNEFTEEHRNKIAKVWKNSPQYENITNSS